MSQIFRQRVQFVVALAVNSYVVLLVLYLALRLLFGDGFWWLSLLNTFAHLLFLPLLVLLPLALLIRARGAALRLLPLIVVAGLWFVPAYLPKTVLAANPTLKVLTFNVWRHNHDLHQIEGWVRQTQADIVMLQEISPTYATDTLPGLLDIYPYQSSQADNTRWGGNIILSRYPILSQDYIDLQTPDNPSPLRLVLDVDGEAVAVYNVHLAWPSRQTPRLSLPWDNFGLRVLLGFDDRIRNQQIQHLVDHLKTEPHPFIIAGDFNASSSSATYQPLATVMRDSFHEVGVGFGGTWPVSQVRGLLEIVPPLIRIDYIWHSDQFRALDAQRGPELGSDHLPLLVTLALPSS
ncbi:MAG TPA: endonuclease/exonuclease/phosphatase family protein [Phototrophicaceae bacterium]|nr:endonuclease/exonuclease/phosphatase family protein [Phototrophicaceae bacterium]